MEEYKVFNSKIYVFVTEAVNRAIYLRTNEDRLVITPKGQSTLTTIEDLINNPTTGLIYKFSLYSHEETRTKLITDEVNILHRTLLRNFRIVYAEIPESALTPADRLALNIPKRDTTPTSIVLVDYVPDIKIEKITHNNITFRINNPLTPDSRAMPHGHHCNLIIGFKTTATGPVIWDVNRIFEPHKALFNVTFKNEDKGKEAFYCVRYVTRTGETGAWGEIFSTVVI